jgi:Ca2+-binding RTX toxin-like protein
VSRTFITTVGNPNQSITYMDTQGATVTAGRSMEVRIITPDAAGSYPVVFYSHGHTAVPAGTGSANAKALADLGYIVILPTHLDSLANPAEIRDAYPLSNPASTLHRVADIKFALDQLPNLMASAPGYTADATSPVIAGHSHGSWTAYLLTGAVARDTSYTTLPAGNPYGLSGLVDPRFKASIVLSPPGPSAVNDVGPGFDEQSWAAYAMPSLSITGTLDVTALEPDYSVRLRGFDGSPGIGKHAIVMRDAEHAQIGGFGATADHTDAIAASMDAFLDAYVKAQPNLLSTPGASLALSSLFSEAYVRSGGVSLGEIVGTASGDMLFGRITDDAIWGGADDDSLSGEAGNDFLTGGAGDDVLIGGTGFDYANFLDATSGVSVSLLISLAQAVGGGLGTDTLSDVEGLYGSQSGDTLLGDNADVNAVYGWGGNDLISGNGGFDYVEGGEGDDTVDGGAGDDYLLGGNGTDTVTFAGSGAAVYVDMSGASAFANGTATGFDVLSGVERIYGSIYGDFLFGSAGQDTLAGDQGIDIIYGFGLGDSLDGGADTDYIVGGAGADTITTGAGQDYIYFQGQSEGKDTITDWRASGFDILCIDEPSFGAGLAINQYLSDSGNAGRFVAGTAATANIGQFLWNSATSTLSWDADGTGAGAAVQLVTLTGVSTLTAGDILVL